LQQSQQEHIPLLKQGLLSNRFAAGWLTGMIAFVLAMTFVPFMQNVLQTTSLNSIQWVMVVAGALLASMWIELVKWLRREQTA
jgi:magnesium-transporting ATPase (P-type)